MAQGKTLEYVIVDIKRPPGETTSEASLYVSLSRVQNVNNLLILRIWDDDADPTGINRIYLEMTTPRSAPFIKEMNRLHEEQLRTIKLFGMHNCSRYFITHTFTGRYL